METHYLRVDAVDANRINVFIETLVATVEEIESAKRFALDIIVDAFSRMETTGLPESRQPIDASAEHRLVADHPKRKELLEWVDRLAKDEAASIEELAETLIAETRLTGARVVDDGDGASHREGTLSIHVHDPALISHLVPGMSWCTALCAGKT